MITVLYFPNYLWPNSSGPAAFTSNLTSRKQIPLCLSLSSLINSGARHNEVLRWHRHEYYWYIEEKERSKTLKNDSLSAFTTSQLGKWWQEVQENLLSSSLPSPRYTNNANKCHHYCKLFWGILDPNPCFMFLVSSSWGGQDKAMWIKTAIFHQRALEFSHWLWTSSWFLCMDLHTSFPLGVWGVLLVLQMSQLKHLLSKCSLNPSYSFSKWQALAHTLYRAFYHAGWHWLFWTSDSTSLIT